MSFPHPQRVSILLLLVKQLSYDAKFASVGVIFQSQLINMMDEQMERHSFF